MVDNEEIFLLSIYIGEEIIRCGGEVHRAEDTIRRINNSFGNKCYVFAIPSLIIAQSEKNIQLRRIEKEDTNLLKLLMLNDLSRRLCEKSTHGRFIPQEKAYSSIFEIICVFIATFSFCLFFGGELLDGVLSGIIGLIITYMPNKKIPFPLFSSNLLDAFIAGTLSYLPLEFCLTTNPEKIIIGTIMLLVPGLTIVNAIRDMMNGDMVAGLFELFNAIISALGIALGVAGAILLFSKI